MFNPLVDSFDDLSDEEVEEKVRSLSRKYFQSRNPQLQEQVAIMLDMYKQELQIRIARKSSQSLDGNEDLDNLINIS